MGRTTRASRARKKKGENSTSIPSGKDKAGKPPKGSKGKQKGMGRESGGKSNPNEDEEDNKEEKKLIDDDEDEEEEEEISEQEKNTNLLLAAK